MGHAKTVNLWRCDHCGKEEAWGPNWRSRLILHKAGGPGPWDEELVACSTECATAIDEKRKWRKLPDKSKGEPAVEISGGQLQCPLCSNSGMVSTVSTVHLHILMPNAALPGGPHEQKTTTAD